MAVWEQLNDMAAPNLFAPNTASPNATGGVATIGQTSSSVTLQSSLTSSTYGQGITLTATASGSGATPTGSVIFYDGNSVLGTSPLSNGVATLSTTFIAAGSRSVTAHYSGDSTYVASTSTAVTITVAQAQTSITVSSNLSPATYGKLVTLTATVSVIAPGTASNLSGVVTFTEGVTALGTVSLNNSSSAYLSLSTLSVGSHTITASFAGNANYAASSGTFTEVVNPAPAKFNITSSAVGASADYAPYLYDKVVKTDRINEPDYLDMSLVPWDNNFVKLSRGAYVTFYTQTYGIWYTGYVTNDPEMEQLGVQNNTPIFGFKYELSGDDYPLNLKPLGIQAPFLNMTQGQILKRLVQTLAPNENYDVSSIADGLTLSRYVVDPQQYFSDIVKEFCTAANYRWMARAGSLYFIEANTVAAGLVIDGNDPHFTPSKLSLTPSKDPIINDAIVLGDIEPQNLMIEYHMGDGYTTRFPLISSVFGADSSVLLDDDFSSSSIDTTKWDVYDVPQNFLQVFNGYLNALGGTNTGSFDVWLQSAALVPLEGNIRITHGVYSFIQASDGVIASLWKNSPDVSGGTATALSNCIYGLRATKNSDGSTTLQPLLHGAADNTQSQLISNYDLIYIIRTQCTFVQPARWVSDYSYMNADGSVATVGGTGVIGTASFQTYIVAYDPATNTKIWDKYFTNDNVQIPDNTVYAYYMPVVLNDLHCTVQGITISVPMQVSLEWCPRGGTVWTRKLVAANDMDSYDGLQPTATITDANQGWQTRSSKFGRSQYNPGSAVLEYISNPSGDPTAPSVAPGVGDGIKVTYRRAGAAMARVQNKTSVAAESAAWGDNGLRSVTRQDLKPSPRSTMECEAAAQAIVFDYGRQHWDGTYSLYSTYSMTGELVSGSILKFQNLTQFGYSDSLTAEAIQEVQSTLVSTSPVEIFEVSVRFGRASAEEQLLPRFTKKTDVFMPQDTAEIPDAIDTASVGTVFADEVYLPALSTYNRDYIFFNFNQGPPPGGGFEVRYSDDSWGADPGRNLLGRTNGASFGMPRTARGKVLFVKAYDARNNVIFSEDLTAPNWVKTNVSAVNSTLENPNGNLSLITTLTFTQLGGSIWQNINVVPTDGLQGVFSTSVKGVAGEHISLDILTLDQNGTGFVYKTMVVTFNGKWQRIAFPVTFDATCHTAVFPTFASVDSTPTFQATRCSFEVNTLTETAYFKTLGDKYGAQSRWATGLRVNAPLIPPAPKATLNYADPAAPVITVPQEGNDVWGYQIRLADNQYVVQQADFNTLTSPGPQTWVHKGNTSRDLRYFVYYYNLMYEYSPAQTLTATIPGPHIQNLRVDDATKRVLWEGVNGDSFMVELHGETTYTPNLLYFSEDLTNPVWFSYNRGGSDTNVVGNASLDPSGVTNNATQINLPATGVSAMSGWAQEVPIGPLSGKTYTFSVYLRADSPTFCYVELEGYDYAQETWTECNVTTEWQRFSATVTFPATTTTGLRMMVNGGGVGTPATTVYAWGAQLEESATMGAYTPSQLGPVLSTHTVSVQEYVLSDSDFFSRRSISVTPYDNMGAGTPSIINHFYKPAPVISFMPTVEVVNVAVPPAPHTDPAPPPTIAPTYHTDYIATSWSDYQINRNRRLQD